MALSRPLTALTVAALLAAALTSCSVNVVDGGAPAEPSAEQSTPPTDFTVEKQTSADDTDERDQGGLEGLDRETLIASATTVRRCDGELTILDDAVTMRIEGACDRLILNTRGSQIVTDDVAFLEVIGDGNVVLSSTVDKLLVNGAANVVQWQGATPTITETGSANVLTAG